jgi:hypothetical protein
MALDADNVRVAVTGAVYSGPTATTAPTGTAAATTGFDDLGYVSEDGVTLSLPDAAESQPIKAWQNGATVRTIRSAPDENPTIVLTLIETKLEVIETVFGVTVTQVATEGSFEIDVTETRTPLSFLIDVVDGAELVRAYAPQGVVTSVGEIALTNTTAIGYQITIECERNTSKGYNLKTWMTALLDPA